MKNLANTNKGITTIRASIKTTLARLGVFTPTIEWDAIGGAALVSFEFKGKRIEKRLKSQPDARRNLQAISVWLKNRVIGFERELETFDEGFSGYGKITGGFEQNVNTVLTPYDILGCKEADDIKTIEREYKRNAFLWHPDRHQNDVVAEERFKEINVAWQKIKELKQ